MAVSSGVSARDGGGRSTASRRRAPVSTALPASISFPVPGPSRHLRCPTGLREKIDHAAAGPEVASATRASAAAQSTFTWGPGVHRRPGPDAPARRRGLDAVEHVERHAADVAHTGGRRPTRSRACAGAGLHRLAGRPEVAPGRPRAAPSPGVQRARSRATRPSRARSSWWRIPSREGDRPSGGARHHRDHHAHVPPVGAVQGVGGEGTSPAMPAGSSHGQPPKMLRAAGGAAAAGGTKKLGVVRSEPGTAGGGGGEGGEATRSTRVAGGRGEAVDRRHLREGPRGAAVEQVEEVAHLRDCGAFLGRR